MMQILKGGKVLRSGQFKKADLLICQERIELIQDEISAEELQRAGLNVQVIDCTGGCLIPGLIDVHAHISGGSGERGGFFSQSPPVTVSECVLGGVTTIVGTIGVDTTTKTMEDLLAKARAFNEVGMTAYAYVGGYDIPPKTITGSVRNDLLFIPEIIGVGEIAIADARAPEPSLQLLAQAVTDAYVGGMLTGKAGVSHFHAGGGIRRLKIIRELMERHEVVPEKIYVTHLERSEELVDEGIELARRGCFVDFDIHERDVGTWYDYYRKKDGPLSQLSFSSDAGVSSPQELWEEVCSVSEEYGVPLEQLLNHVTTVPAKALKLPKKGKLEVGLDADIAVYDEATKKMKHVFAKGKAFLKDGQFLFANQPIAQRRGVDFYGIHEKN